MKCLFHSFFKFYLFTLISVSTLLAQSPDAMITRDQYLDKLEERFRSASSELSEISGVEFEVPANSMGKPSGAQKAFDQLPGPINNLTPDLLSDEEIIREIMGEEEEQDLEVLVVDDANATDEDKVLEVEVMPQRYLEDELGQFFVQPFIGLSIIPDNIKLYNGVTFPEVEHNLGSGVGLIYGRRWGNLTGELHLGHFVNDFSGRKESTITSSLPVIPFTTQIDGSTEYTNVGARLGYGIPYGERGWLKAAFGFGFAQRRTSADVFTLLGNTIVNSATSASESVFTYDFLVAMAYELGIGWDAVLSYRFMNMDEYESSDDLSVHFFELGLGKNF